jgi:AcrR family transcriptional regulator
MRSHRRRASRRPSSRAARPEPRRYRYLHFRDKYDLIERLADEQVAWIEQTGAAAIADPQLSRATVIRTVDEIVSRWTENHAVLSAIIELAEYDARMRDTWRSAMHEVAGGTRSGHDRTGDLARASPAGRSLKAPDRPTAATAC